MLRVFALRLLYNIYMFYFDDFCGYKVLISDYITDIDAFFTTRNGFDFDVLNATRVITPTQTHSDNVEFADERVEYPNTDGLIFSKKGDAGYLRFADCTPLIFYNSKTGMAAISHAGWRGTAQRIGVKTVEKMGGNPKDITVLIGSAIGKCCYEVSIEVKDKLLGTVKNKGGLSDGRYVDLKTINARQLEEIGVVNIDICPYCTSCDNDLFYSYRKENGTENRHYAVVKI